MCLALRGTEVRSVADMSFQPLRALVVTRPLLGRRTRFASASKGCLDGEYSALPLRCLVHSLNNGRWCEPADH
eukprot:3531113-Pleurochrysis_carterae.AAC.1